MAGPQGRRKADSRYLQSRESCACPTDDERRTVDRYPNHDGGTLMARPPKIVDYFVHRVAEAIQLVDEIHKNRQMRNEITRGGLEVIMGDGEILTVDTQDEIALAVGRNICEGVWGGRLK